MKGPKDHDWPSLAPWAHGSGQARPDFRGDKACDWYRPSDQPGLSPGGSKISWLGRSLHGTALSLGFLLSEIGIGLMVVVKDSVSPVKLFKCLAPS